MAYRRRSRSGRRYRRRRSYRRRRGSRMKRAIVSTVNRMAETKWCIFATSAIWPTITSAAWSHYIPSIANGSSIFGQRVGRKIAIKGFSIIGTLQGGQSNVALDDKYNVIRFCTGIARGAQAAPAGTPLSTIGFNDPILKVGSAAQNNITVMHDRYITLVSQSRDSTGYMPAVKRFYFKHLFKKPLTITYADDTANTPNQNIFIAFLGDSNIAPSPGFTTGFLKVYYKDI